MQRVGTLEFESVLEHQGDVAPVVYEALKLRGDAQDVGVSSIDPTLSDTASFCEAYNISASESANCVVLKTKKGTERGFAACVVLASTRADINGKVCDVLSIKGASFAPMEEAVALTGMEFGAITPIGLPLLWPILIDSRVAQAPYIIIGSGVRGSKIVTPGAFLSTFPNVQVIEGLAAPRQ